MPHHAGNKATMVKCGAPACSQAKVMVHQLPPGAVLHSLTDGAPKRQISLLLPEPSAHPAPSELAGIARELARGAEKARMS